MTDTLVSLGNLQRYAGRVKTVTDAINSTVGTHTTAIANIKTAINGRLYDCSTDTTTAYKKNVPSGAKPYASLNGFNGKCFCWNQLVKTTHFSSTTLSGITFTNNGDGTITANGTSTGSVLNSEWNIGQDGHKFLICGCPSGGSSTTYNIVDGYAHGSDVGSGFITSSTSYTGSIIIYIASGVTVSNLVFKPKMFDLTLIENSLGITISTVEQFEALFPNFRNESYCSSEIRCAQTQSVESVGVNLLNFYGAGAVYPSVETYESQEAYKVEGYASYSNLSIRIPCKLKANTAYTISAKFRSLSSSTLKLSEIVFGVKYSDGTTSNISASGQFTSRYETFNSEWKSVSSTKTFTKDVVEILFGLYAALQYCYIQKDSLQIESGSSATSYKPYISSAWSVPSSVKSLTGYGWSEGSVYNEVNCIERKYAQRVTKLSVTGAVGAAITLTGAKSGTSYLCALGDVGTVSGTTLTLTTALTSQDVYYELATPVETDISSYLETVTFLRVESGGTLEFKNQLTNQFIPIASSETYEVKLADVS